MKKYILPLLMVFVLTSCNNPQIKEVAFQGETQGTYYMLKYYDAEGRNFQADIEDLLKELDNSLSLWVPTSVISKVNKNEAVKLDKYFIDNYNLSMRIARETGGAFDFTLGPLIEAWGFGFREKIRLTQEKVDSIKDFVGYEKVELKNEAIFKTDERMEVNFNAIAQGYSVDLIGEFLNKMGVENYLVDVGGEILTKGVKPGHKKWAVGIQLPTEDAHGEIESQVVVELTDKAFVTSGSYRKYYEENGKRYSHIIDPQSGFPVTHNLLSVTVLAETCAESDGYATAFMTMGLEKAKAFVEERDDLEAYFIYDDNGFMKTDYTFGLESLIRN